MTNELAVQETTMSLVMNADMKTVTKQLQAIANFQSVVQSQLKKGQDYGEIPGTNKPTLLKPGAEKILMLFGAVSEYEEIERVQDYDHGFFAYTIKCTLRQQNGQKITEGLGHCNTKEKKYINQDAYTLANTCLKMAKKRAQVDATLTIASLSEIFTQDIEDLTDFAKRERVETLDVSTARQLKVMYKKHKGKTLGQVFDEDKGYVEWMAENANDEALKAASLLLLSAPIEGEIIEKSNNNQQKSITKEQIAEINNLASIVAVSNGLSVEQVITAYQVPDLALLNESTASDLIRRLNVKVDSAMRKEAEKVKQEELFSSSNSPLSGKEIDISDDDLPF